MPHLSVASPAHRRPALRFAVALTATIGVALAAPASGGAALTEGRPTAPAQPIAPAVAERSMASITDTRSEVSTEVSTEVSADTDLGDGVVVELTGMDPVVVTPDSGLTLTGTVRNNSEDEVLVTEVEARTSLRGLDTRELLSAWEEGRGAITAQRPLGSEELELRLAPDVSAPFTIDIAPEDITAPFDYANLPLLVEATIDQQPDEDGEDGEAGPSEAEAPTPQVHPLRTYLVWNDIGDADLIPLQVGTLIPLTAPADDELWSTDPEVSALAWSSVTGPTSTQAALVRQLTGRPVTFMVDPTLVDPVLPPDTLYAPPEPDPTEPDPTEPIEGETPTEAPGTPESTEAPTGTSGADLPSQPDDASSTEAPATGQNEQSEQGEQGEPPSGTDPEDGAGDSPGSEPSDPAEPSEPSGPADPAAQGENLPALLSDLRPGQLWWTPHGDPDLARFAELDWGLDRIATVLGDRDPQRAVSEGALPGPTQRTQVAWPETGSDPVDLDQLADTWQAIHPEGRAGTAELNAVVQPGSALGIDPNAVPPGVGRSETGQRILAYDETIADLLGAPADTDTNTDTDTDTTADTVADPPSGSASTSAARAQRVVAESLAAYQEAPANPRSLLIAVPRDVAVDAGTVETVLDGLQESPWINPTSANALLNRPALSLPELTLTAPAIEEESGTPTDGPTRSGAAPGVIDEDLVTEIEEVSVLLDGGSAMVPEGVQRRDLWYQVLGQAYSVRWRTDPEALTAVVQRPGPIANEVLDSLEVVPTTINFLADEGQIQVTVASTLPVPISDVEVALTPSHQRLRVVEQAEPIGIGAESRATVRVRAQAVAAGEVEVDVSLRAPNGTPMGEVTGVQVRVQPMGSWIFWVLLGVAGVILVIGLWRALRPRREPEAPSQPDAPDPDDPEPDDPEPDTPQPPHTTDADHRGEERR